MYTFCMLRLRPSALLMRFIYLHIYIKKKNFKKSLISYLLNFLLYFFRSFLVNFVYEKDADVVKMIDLCVSSRFRKHFQ
jgi:hypothetical protein